MEFRNGQWVVVGGKLIGIVVALGSIDADGGQVPAAQVDLVDENGETMNRNLVQLSDLMPVTVLEDIPAPRRAHLPADYDPVSGRSRLASMFKGEARSEFVSAKSMRPGAAKSGRR